MHLKYYEDNVEILDWGGGKCKGSVSWCRSELKMGLSLQHVGEKGFEGTKSTLFLSKRQRNTLLLARLCGSLPLDVRLQKHIYLSVYTYVEP